MSNLTDALIAAKLVGGSGGSGGGSGLPDAYNYVIVASDFGATSDYDADFYLTAVDGWIMGHFEGVTDPETGEHYLTYTFNPDPFDEGNVPPSFWGNGNANIQAGLAFLLDLKLNVGRDASDTLAHKLCDPNSNMLVFGFTL